MRRFSLVIAVLVAIVVFERQSSAVDVLTLRLFEQYLESFRVEAVVPAMSGVIVQDGVVVWKHGFGRQDLEGAIAARSDTPYPIGSLSQVVGSTMLLRTCVDGGSAELIDKVVRWMPLYPEPLTTISQLLSHTAPSGAFHYDPSRMSALTGVVEECADQKYASLVAHDLLDQLVMGHSVPGQALATPTTADEAIFEPARLAYYANVLRTVATPYRVISRRPVRNTEFVAVPFTVSNGLVTSAEDLAEFDKALDADRLLAPITRVQAFTQTFSGATPLPTGLGWFVQNYNNEAIVWQFGLVENAYSSLYLKVPNRKLTFILLANSDGLSAPFSLDAGDVTTSIFAKTFLRTFLP